MPYDMKLLLLLVLVWSPGMVDMKKWVWPGQMGDRSVKIDNKVRFVDSIADPSKERPTESEPIPSAGTSQEAYSSPAVTEPLDNEKPDQRHMYPLRIQSAKVSFPRDQVRAFNLNNSQPAESTSYKERRPNSETWLSNYDSNLNTMQYCHCTSEKNCEPRTDLPYACAPGKVLCCYPRPQNQRDTKNEYFSGVDDERPLFIGPGSQADHGPFPPPRDGLNTGLFSLAQNHMSSVMGPLKKEKTHETTAPIGKRPIYVAGSSRPSFGIKPKSQVDVLVNTPYGSQKNNHFLNSDGVITYTGISPNEGVLIGPNGPAGIISSEQLNQRHETLDTATSQIVSFDTSPELLVGPNGPSGMFGPRKEFMYNPPNSFSNEETGTVDPNRFINRFTIDGQVDKTGILGPNHSPVYIENEKSNSERNVNFIGLNNMASKPNILVGPGGPTAILGPTRDLVYSTGALIRPADYSDPTNNNNDQLEIPNVVNQVASKQTYGSNGEPVYRPGVLSNFRRTDLSNILGQNRLAGPPSSDLLVGPGGPKGIIGPNIAPDRPSVLVGPGGVTGIIGPVRDSYPVQGILSGPSRIPLNNYVPRPILVGPGGATGIIGPNRQPQRQQSILNTPSGNPLNNYPKRPNVLVGPGGATGIIGPNKQFPQRPEILTGPIHISDNVGRKPLGRNPEVLIGPGGPTGVMGPQYKHDVLTGPEGPVGIIGPQGAAGPYSQYRNGQGVFRSAAFGTTAASATRTSIYKRKPDFFGARIGSTGARPVLVGPGGYTGLIGSKDIQSKSGGYLRNNQSNAVFL